MEQGIGHKIKLIRQARKVSQLDLAKRIGIDNSRLSLIENGHVEPSAEQLAAIKATLRWPENAAEAFAILEGTE